MVPPYDGVLDVADVHVQLLGDLAEGSVLVEPCEAGDVLGGDYRGGLFEDERVCVRRVSHDQNLQSSVKVYLLAHFFPIVLRMSVLYVTLQFGAACSCKAEACDL